MTVFIFCTLLGYQLNTYFLTDTDSYLGDCFMGITPQGFKLQSHISVYSLWRHLWG